MAYANATDATSATGHGYPNDVAAEASALYCPARALVKIRSLGSPSSPGSILWRDTSQRKTYDD